MSEDYKNFINSMEGAPHSSDDDRLIGIVDEGEKDVSTEVGDWFLGRDNMEIGIDYDTGIQSSSFRSGFGLTDTPEEKASFLNYEVGVGGRNGNWFADTSGRHIITPQGQRNLVDKYGITPSDKPVALDELAVSKYDISDGSGLTGPLIGGIGAPLVAGLIASNPIGWAAGALIAGTGAAIGTIVQEGYEELVIPEHQLQSWNDFSDSSVADAAYQEFLWATAGEGGGRFVTGLFGSAFKGTPLDSAVVDKVHKALSEGYQVPLSAVEGGTMKSRIQTLSELVVGSPGQNANRTILENKQRDILVNIIGEEKPKTGRELADVLYDTAEDGLGKYKQRLTLANEHADATISNLRTTIDGEFSTITKLDPELMRRQIGAAKTEASNAASVRYAALDDLVGNRKIINTSGLKTKAQAIFDEQLKLNNGNVAGLDPAVVSKLNEIIKEVPDNISLSDMQSYRTDLLSHSLNRDLVANSKSRTVYARLVKSATETFDSAKVGHQVAAKIKETGAWYDKNVIKRFDHSFLNKMAKDASELIEADEYVNGALWNQPTSQARILKDIMTDPAALKEGTGNPQVWRGVQREYQEKIFKESVDPITGGIDGRALLNNLNKNKEVIELVLGADKAKALRNYGGGLHINAGDIDLKSFTKAFPDIDPTTMQSLRGAAAKRQEWETIQSRTWMQNLTSKNQQDFDNAVEYLFRPGNSAETLHAKTELGKVLGIDSTVWKQVQHNAMKKVLAGGDPKGAIKGPGNFFDPVGFKETLNEYGKDSLTAMFGRDMANDLFKLADITDVAITGRGGSVGQIAAAAIAINPLSHIPTIARMNVVSRAMSSPTFLKGYIKFMSRDISLAERTRAMVRALGVQRGIVAANESIGEDDKQKALSGLDNSIYQLNSRQGGSDIDYKGFLGDVETDVPQGKKNGGIVHDYQLPTLNRPEYVDDMVQGYAEGGYVTQDQMQGMMQQMSGVQPTLQATPVIPPLQEEMPKMPEMGMEGLTELAEQHAPMMTKKQKEKAKVKAVKKGNKRRGAVPPPTTGILSGF